MKTTVKEELVDEGLSEEESSKLVDRLSEEEIRVLSENPEMIESAGDEDVQNAAAVIVIFFFLLIVLAAAASSGGGA